MQFELRLSVAAVLAASAVLAACGQKTETPAAPAASGGNAAAAPAADAQVVKLASVAPMSGSQAHYGKDNANGVLMAVDDLNQQGVTIGGKPVRDPQVMLELIAALKPGETAAFKLRRDKAVTEAQVRVGKRPTARNK